MKDLKVAKDGRVRLSRAKVEEQGLRPGDVVPAGDVVIKPRGLRRRTAVRLIGTLGLGAVTLATVADVEGFLSLLERLKRAFDPEADPRLVAALFGVTAQGTGSIILASDNPFAPPPAGAAWYPIEQACAVAYFERFSTPEVRLQRVVRGFPTVQAQDGVVALGSQVSNYFARTVLGDPKGPEPLLTASGPTWTANLHWNLHTPAHARQQYRKQFGVDWLGTEHEIVSSTGNFFRVTWDHAVQKDDYLLITALPRTADGPERTLIFGGIHAAGTLAAERLFRDAPESTLKEIAKATNSEPYYQALLHVDVRRDQTGEAKPRKLTLVDARPIQVLHVNGDREARISDQ